MKSKGLQKPVIAKYEAGQILKKIFEDLNGLVSCLRLFPSKKSIFVRKSKIEIL